MKAMILFACLFAFVAPQAWAGKPLTCGIKSKRAVVSTITLAGPRADEGGIPAFYVYNEGFNNVMFFRPGDAVTTLHELVEREEKWRGEGAATGLRWMISEIEKDLPLGDHTDLNKYALRLKTNHWGIQALVMEMLRAGRASVAYWNYFDLHPTVVVPPTERLTLYIVEDPVHIFGAQFCSERGGTVYTYTSELE